MTKIGRGSWIDLEAIHALEKKENAGKAPGLFRTESGLGASGFPHIGSFGDAARNFIVKLAAEDLGYKAEYIAFADDMDGLRKVPSGLPDSLTQYLGMPVSTIPDPFGCHDNYGMHFSSLLLEALDTWHIEYTHMSAHEMYKTGALVEQIETIFKNAEAVGQIVQEVTGQERYTEVLPYHAVCGGCGKMYTTAVTGVNLKSQTVSYECVGTELRGTPLPGCGHIGEADYTKAQGKLNWKVEFGARWAALNIDFEAHGKDILDSVRVNDRICKEILGVEAPYHLVYEMFLDPAGTKISKSIGNVLTPQVWNRYGTRESLLLLNYKRVQGARLVGIKDIPNYMDEFDDLEKVYFGRKKEGNPAQKRKLTALYEYCNLLKPPETMSLHVPYQILTNLIAVAPEDSVNAFVVEKLREYGYLKEDVPVELSARIGCAKTGSKIFTRSR
jgi:lysyl-tRNA synthetase class 1